LLALFLRVNGKHWNGQNLRIVDDTLWDRVQARRKTQSTRLDEHRQSGKTLLKGRPAIAGNRRSVFTGFLICGVCGRAVSTVSNHVHGGRRYRYFGCSNYARNGPAACSNRVTARVEDTEAVLLAGLRAELLKPDTLAYVIERIAAAIQALSNKAPSRRAELRRRIESGRSKITHLVAAVEAETRPLRFSARCTIVKRISHNSKRNLPKLANHHDISGSNVSPAWVQSQLEALSSLLSRSHKPLRWSSNG
jgi:hypothetical protein